MHMCHRASCSGFGGPSGHERSYSSVSYSSFSATRTMSVSFSCGGCAATVEFVRVWLSFLQKALEDAAPESAQKNINLAILRNLELPLPPVALQQTFATRIQAIESLKATHWAALTELDALFASLQQRAFTGAL